VSPLNNVMAVPDLTDALAGVAMASGANDSAIVPANMSERGIVKVTLLALA
jgi:hypothetical protein